MVETFHRQIFSKNVIATKYVYSFVKMQQFRVKHHKIRITQVQVSSNNLVLSTSRLHAHPGIGNGQVMGEVSLPPSFLTAFLLLILEGSILLIVELFEARMAGLCCVSDIL